MPPAPRTSPILRMCPVYPGQAVYRVRSPTRAGRLRRFRSRRHRLSAEQQAQDRLRPRRVRLLAEDEVEVGVALDDADDREREFLGVAPEIERARLVLVPQHLVHRGGQAWLELVVGPGEQSHGELTLLEQEALH